MFKILMVLLVACFMLTGCTESAEAVKEDSATKIAAIEETEADSIELEIAGDYVVVGDCISLYNNGNVKLSKDQKELLKELAANGVYHTLLRLPKQTISLKDEYPPEAELEIESIYYSSDELLEEYVDDGALHYNEWSIPLKKKYTVSYRYDVASGRKYPVKFEQDANAILFEQAPYPYGSGFANHYDYGFDFESESGESTFKVLGDKDTIIASYPVDEESLDLLTRSPYDSWVTYELTSEGKAEIKWISINQP